jgi:hypothetical protein
MANVSTVSLQLVASVANGVALSQVPTGALTLNGSLVTGGVATFDTARRVIVSSSAATADQNLIFTITGTDRYGYAQTSTVTGVVSGTPAVTALDYATVTGVSVNGTATGNITAGTNGTASTQWILDDPTATQWMLAVACSLPGGNGSATYTVEHTYDDPARTGTTLVVQPQQYSRQPAGYTPPLVWPDANLTNKTTNGETNFANQPIMAHRLTVTNGTGLVVMQSIQAGLGYG